jgi:hypothetical protein
VTPVYGDSRMHRSRRQGPCRGDLGAYHDVISGGPRLADKIVHYFDKLQKIRTEANSAGRRVLNNRRDASRQGLNHRTGFRWNRLGSREH